MGDALLFVSMIVGGMAVIGASVTPFIWMLFNKAGTALMITGTVISVVFMFFACVFWTQLTMWVFS